MKIWLLSFESIYTRKIGGLGEVPPRLGEALKSKGHEVYVLTPSHGSVKDDMEAIDSLIVDSVEHRVYLYSKPPVPHIVFSGGILDDERVYSPDILDDKILLWGRIIRLYAERIHDRPDIVHGNDWHSVPALISLNALLKDQTRYFYQIHLLSRKKYELLDLTKRIGIDENTPIKGIYGLKPLRYYYDRSNGLLDRLGALISDKLLTVSRNYLKTVIRRLGLDLERHTDYIPNATTWKLQDIIENVSRTHRLILDEKTVFTLGRRTIRRYFELEAPNRMDRPVIDDEDARRYIYSLDEYPFRGDGRIFPFSEEGPLVILTGRLSRQKGIHVILKIVEELVAEIPDIRVTLLLLPVWGERRLLEELVHYTMSLKDNLRVVFGRSRELFYLAHLAGDVMAIPSLYEPFGLVALEGMLTGNSIVASKTGGLAETVVDLTLHGLKGTGIHVEPGDPEDLLHGLKNMVLLMESGYYKPWSPEWWRLVERIDDNILRDLLVSNPQTPWIIRLNSHNRALEYTWDKSAEKALEIYKG